MLHKGVVIPFSCMFFTHALQLYNITVLLFNRPFLDDQSQCVLERIKHRKENFLPFS